MPTNYLVVCYQVFANKPFSSTQPWFCIFRVFLQYVSLHCSVLSRTKIFCNKDLEWNNRLSHHRPMHFQIASSSFINWLMLVSTQDKIVYATNPMFNYSLQSCNKQSILKPSFSLDCLGTTYTSTINKITPPRPLSIQVTLLLALTYHHSWTRYQCPR